MMLYRFAWALSLVAHLVAAPALAQEAVTGLRSDMVAIEGAGAVTGLQSALVAVQQPGDLSIYETAPHGMMRMARVDTLRQQPEPGFARNGPVETAAQSTVRHGWSFWTRAAGGTRHIAPKRSTLGARFDQDDWQVQAGARWTRPGFAGGDLGLSLAAHFGESDLHSWSQAGESHADLTAYGLALGGTWMAYAGWLDGFFIDVEAKFTWFDMDLYAAGFGPLVDSRSAFGMSFGGGGGMAHDLGGGWSLASQGQIIYTHVSLDSFTDQAGMMVNLTGGDSFTSSFYLSLDHRRSWQGASGAEHRSHVYASVGVVDEWLDGVNVTVAGLDLSHELDTWTIEAALGGEYELYAGALALYGEISAATGLGDFGESYALRAMGGVKSHW